jgi:hypothetical protein
MLKSGEKNAGNVYFGGFKLIVVLLFFGIPVTAILFGAISGGWLLEREVY